MTTRLRRALVTTLTALVATSSQVPVTVATQQRQSDNHREHLTTGVRDQINKEIVLLEQIRPHLDSSSSGGERSPTTRSRQDQNAARQGRPSNLAFLELADQEKRDMVARYKAIGGEPTTDKDNDKNSAANFLTQLMGQDDFNSADESIDQFLADKPLILGKMAHPEISMATAAPVKQTKEKQTSKETESSHHEKEFVKEQEAAKETATPIDIDQRMIEFEGILELPADLDSPTPTPTPTPDLDLDPQPQSQEEEKVPAKAEADQETEEEEEEEEEVEIEIPAAEIEEIVEEVSEEHQQEDEERTKQYDELLDSVEQQKLALVIRWMSIQQTVIMSFLAAAALATILICAYRSCKREQPQLSQDEQMAGLVVGGTLTTSQREANSCRSSPLTFRNLATRKGFVPGRTSDKQAFNRLGGSGSPPNHHDYLYSDDTPSFHGQQFYQLGANRRN